MKAGVHELRLFFTALQFFTRLPVPRWVGFEPAWLHACARYFPLVGLLVGAVAAVVYAAALRVTSPAVAAVLSTLATVVLTGAFHEDGLADTCDALGGHVPRARALEIMKDSRIGSYGAIALVLVVGLKLAVLAALPVTLAVPALLFAHTVSRAMAVVVIRALPYAGDVAAAKARPLAQRVRRREVAIALVTTVIVAAVLVAVRPPWAVPLGGATALALVGAHACARRWHRRLGGFTGDTLGATQQVTEVLALLGWLVWLRLL